MKPMLLTLSLLLTSSFVMAAGPKSVEPGKGKEGRETMAQHPAAADFAKRLETIAGVKMDVKATSELLNANPTLIPLVESVKKSMSDAAGKKGVEIDKAYVGVLAGKVASIHGRALDIRANKPLMNKIRDFDKKAQAEAKDSNVTSKEAQLLEAMEVSIVLMREAVEGGVNVDRAKVDAVLEVLAKVEQGHMLDSGKVNEHIAALEKALGVSLKAFLDNCRN